MSEEIATILERAADRLSKPGAWTQGWMARDEEGLETYLPDAGPAACWCIAGAIDFEAEDQDVRDMAYSTVRGMLNSSISLWNDAPERTQVEVVAKLREAAAKARAGQ